MEYQFEEMLKKHQKSAAIQKEKEDISSLHNKEN